jgi:hypothetical protein
VHSSREDLFYQHKNETYAPPGMRDSDVEAKDDSWQHHVRYVYDAVAERTQQRIRESQLADLTEVHRSS